MQVFLAALWLIHEILVIFIYWNLPALKREVDKHLNDEKDLDTFESETHINNDKEFSTPLLNEARYFVITESEDDTFEIADKQGYLNNSKRTDDLSLDNQRKVNLTWKYIYKGIFLEHL